MRAPVIRRQSSTVVIAALSDTDWKMYCDTRSQANAAFAISPSATHIRIVAKPI
jgi:hypothetical protein